MTKAMAASLASSGGAGTPVGRDVSFVFSPHYCPLIWYHCPFQRFNSFTHGGNEPPGKERDPRP